MNVVGEHYVGRYGGASSEGADVVAVTVQCPVRPVSLARKQIIFTVDVSGSMEDELPAVVASLLGARNALLTALGLPVKDMHEHVIDAEFVRHCRCCLIVFSDTARCIWDSSTDTIVPFTTAVRSVMVNSRTNLGEGLLLSFRKTDTECATWIIVLTDGIPNCGLYQREESFAELIKTTPPHTKIVPLGYGNEFDPSVLSSLGAMTYVESREHIASIMGSIMGEIATCYGLEGTITCDTAPTIVNGTIARIGHIRDIVGSPRMGALYSERCFTYAVVNSASRSGTFTYFDFESWGSVTLNFTVEEGGAPPPSLRSHYFMAAKGRLMHDIYRRRNLKTVDEALVRHITDKLADWTDPLAAEDKEEILRALDINLNRVQQLKLASGIGQYHTQASYERSALTTGIQRELSQQVARNATVYRIPGGTTGILPFHV